MQKKVLALIFILLVNLAICFGTEKVRLSLSETEIERAEPGCRKEGQSCDSSRKCCEGTACNVMIIGLGYMGSVRCGKVRKG